MGGAGHGTLTIKREIFLLSSAFLAVVALIFSGIFLRVLYLTNMDSAKNSLRQCNSQIVTYTEGLFRENASILNLLSRDEVIIDGASRGPDAVKSIHRLIMENSSNITYIYSGYADGSLYINDYPIPQGYDATVRPWYTAAIATNGVARLAYTDASTGERLFSQCKRLVDKDGNITGVLSIDCSNENITRQLSAKYQYTSQRSFIMDASGNVLIHPEVKYIDDSIRNYMDPRTWERIANGSSNYGEYKKSGVNAMAYFERIPETTFIVATAIDAWEVTSPIVRSVMYLLMAVAALCIALGVILSRVMVYRFARPIIALKDRIELIAAGRPEADQKLTRSNAEMNGIADSIEIIVKDITRREEQRKAAEYLSFHDSMTGLYNRRFFEEELQRLDTGRNYPLCLVCCDINGLKLANDVFGHDVGDRLIARVAKCLAAACRADDILARTGGDEFCVIMPRTSDADAARIIRRIKSSFPRENIWGAEVSASLGFAVKEQAGESMDDVLRRADRMMYGRKLTESEQMKRRTAENLINAAEKEHLILPLCGEETRLLGQMTGALCPDTGNLLLRSYRLRNLGLCSLFPTGDASDQKINPKQTENAYRLLSVLDDYRGIAGCILHCAEHWDGSGWPAGLAGRDIPLLSRAIAVVDAYFAAGCDLSEFERHGSWYDPDIVALVRDYVRCIRS